MWGDLWLEQAAGCISNVAAHFHHPRSIRCNTLEHVHSKGLVRDLFWKLGICVMCAVCCVLQACAIAVCTQSTQYILHGRYKALAYPALRLFDLKPRACIAQWIFRASSRRSSMIGTMSERLLSPLVSITREYTLCKALLLA